MKFDNVIIGGGLSGLLCGIQLTKAGRSVAIIAAGQSSMHFSSGSFDLLGYDEDENCIESPLEKISGLTADHPYSKIGAQRIEELALRAQQLFEECSIKLQGDVHRNHYRMTPMGILKPTWLTLQDYITCPNPGEFPYHKVLVANIAGYLDFPEQFIAESLNHLGVKCHGIHISIPALKARRHSPSEMRSANIAKVLSNEETLDQVAMEINRQIQEDDEAVLMPAIVGIESPQTSQLLQHRINLPLQFIPTLPPSVPGVRMHNQLRKIFTRMGGTYLLGNKVYTGEIKDGKLDYILTTNLDDERLYAREFVLATGSFQSDGLQSNFEKVYEPIFNLDVDYIQERMLWTREDIFQAQPFMAFGVHTDAELRCSKEGNLITNLYAIGSVLSGHNPIKQSDGTGVSILTALTAAEHILNR